MWLGDEILIVNLTNLNFDKNFWYEKLVDFHKAHQYDGYNHSFLLPIDFEEFCTPLLKEFHRVSETEFSKKFGDYKLSSKTRNICWAYITNKHDHRGGVHDHIRTSTINSVFYFNIPSKLSGGITFYKNSNEKFLTYYPDNYDLVIFPNYVLHAPENPNTEEYRISINMELFCDLI